MPPRLRPTESSACNHSRGIWGVDTRKPASEQELLALLKPCPDEALKIWLVDKIVGNVARKKFPHKIAATRRLSRGEVKKNGRALARDT